MASLLIAVAGAKKRQPQGKDGHELRSNSSILIGLGFPADGDPDAHEEFAQDWRYACDHVEELCQKIARIEDNGPGRAC
ncbi:MAG: hypothetical protein ACLPPF_12295 [Rhodomicrobium sp.]